MDRDLTTGKPARLIINFTIPVFFGNLFQQLYSLADTVVVGKFIGHTALAAVGACGTIIFLIIGFLQGMTTGFSVVAAQHFGAGNKPALKKSYAMAIWLSLFISVLMTAGSMLFLDDILRLMNTPRDMYRDAYNYMLVICGGIVAQVYYNLLASILRAIGDSKRPLYFLFVAAGLNVVLDLVFVVGFRTGPEGTAYATVISQGISALLCAVYIKRKVPDLHLERSDYRPDFSLMKWEVKLGIPMALQFSITAVGTILVQTALNKLGSVAVAGFAAANRIENLFTQAFMALGTTMATFCAQNIGAGRKERIRAGFRVADGLGIGYAVLTGLLVAFAGKYLTQFFVSDNLGPIMAYADTYLKCVGLTFIPLYVVCVYRSGFQGLGFGLLPMLSGVAELTARSVVALLGGRTGSFLVICLASPAAWVLACLLLLVVYQYIKRKVGLPGRKASRQYSLFKKSML